MVKFGGKIGTLYQMHKNAFKKHHLQNRTNVQIKGGGVKGLLNNVQKNCTFLKCRLPLVEGDIIIEVMLHFILDWNLIRLQFATNLAGNHYCHCIAMEIF